MSSNLLGCVGEEERQKKEREAFLECLLCAIRYDMCTHSARGAFTLCEVFRASCLVSSTQKHDEEELVNLRIQKRKLGLRDVKQHVQDTQLVCHKAGILTQTLPAELQHFSDYV